MQMLITNDSLYAFRSIINGYLEDGWKIVPGTLTILKDEYCVVIESTKDE